MLRRLMIGLQILELRFFIGFFVCFAFMGGFAFAFAFIGGLAFALLLLDFAVVLLFN